MKKAKVVEKPRCRARKRYRGGNGTDHVCSRAEGHRGKHKCLMFSICRHEWEKVAKKRNGIGR